MHVQGPTFDPQQNKTESWEASKIAKPVCFQLPLTVLMDFCVLSLTLRLSLSVRCVFGKQQTVGSGFLSIQSVCISLLERWDHLHWGYYWGAFTNPCDICLLFSTLINIFSLSIDMWSLLVCRLEVMDSLLVFVYLLPSRNVFFSMLLVIGTVFFLFWESWPLGIQAWWT